MERLRKKEDPDALEPAAVGHPNGFSSEEFYKPSIGAITKNYL